MAALSSPPATTHFIAAATDNLIRAIDSETGETLWQDVLPAGGRPIDGL